MDVKQTQKVEGLVGLFDVPVDVEITTSSGRKTFPIEVSEASQSFSFPADSVPLMVLFDKGDKILKTAEFKKDASMLIYQLKNAETVPDRADAALALGAFGASPDTIAALADAAQHDPFWGIRVEALRTLGRIGGAAAEQPILAEMRDDKPWVRDVAVAQLGRFSDDGSLAPTLAGIAANDKAYRVRAAALESLGEIKGPNVYDILVAAVRSDSPDDTLRNAALGALGTLADPRAVPILMEWSAPWKASSEPQCCDFFRRRIRQEKQRNHEGADFLFKRASFRPAAFGCARPRAARRCRRHRASSKPCEERRVRHGRRADHRECRLRVAGADGRKINFLTSQRARKIRKSRRLLPVGPVTTASPTRAKKL